MNAPFDKPVLSLPKGSGRTEEKRIFITVSFVIAILLGEGLAMTDVF